MLEDVQHVQQTTFLLDEAKFSMLNGREWQIQHVQQRPTKQQICSIYIYFLK